MDNLFYLIEGNPLHQQFKVSDALFTEYKCPETRSVFKVWSHLNYFVYVISGKMKWQTRQSDYLVNAGDSIFVKKGANIIHKYFEEDFCSLIIFLPDDFIRTVIQNHPVDLSGDWEEVDDAVIPLILNTRLTSFFQSLFAYFFEKDSPPRELLLIKFKELILNLISSPKQRGCLCRYFKTLCQFEKLSIPEIMEENFAYNLSMKEYAKLCGRSLSTFKRDFADHYEISPGKWLKKKRLEYSKNLLKATEKSVSEIAFISGFANTSHFIQVFKQAYGETPLQFKKSLIEA